MKPTILSPFLSFRPYGTYTQYWVFDNPIPLIILTLYVYVKKNVGYILIDLHIAPTVISQFSEKNTENKD